MGGAVSGDRFLGPVSEILVHEGSRLGLISNMTSTISGLGRNGTFE